jgi:lipoyl(octanoyl) transferase
MDARLVIFKDLGFKGYQETWAIQEQLMQRNLQAKSSLLDGGSGSERPAGGPGTRNYLLFVEHPPVFTLGKSGHRENVLIGDQEREDRGIQFYHTNRGGDITFHGPGQLVVYPILDLEKFYTDIGRYMRELEEVIIRSLAHFGIQGRRSTGETGVWVDPDIPGKERKIAALGVRCSRWITMHGFALNVNTDLAFFDHIVPCGIQHKKVTSIYRESGRAIPLVEVKQKVRKHFEEVFCAVLSETEGALTEAFVINPLE